MSKDSLGDLLFGVAVFITAIFSVLKLCKVIYWSWWWVLCPIWLWILFMIFLIVYLLKSNALDNMDENLD